jgi:hypothetical protein
MHSNYQEIGRSRTELLYAMTTAPVDAVPCKRRRLDNVPSMYRLRALSEVARSRLRCQSIPL